jgi:predicted GTPase
MPNAEVEKTRQELQDFLGVRDDEILEISAKTGQNVELVLQRIISDIPAPQINNDPETPLQALIFDSYFDTHKGAIPEPVAINTSGVAGVIVVGTVNCPSGAKNSTSLPNGSVLKKCEPTPLGMTSTKSSKPCALLGSLQSEYERRVPLG